MKKQTSVPCPATLYAAALYLTTRYAQNGCPTVCRMVIQQFEHIVNHPDPVVPDDLCETCRKLQADWERIGTERELVMRKAAVLATAAAAVRPLH
jgi:hypothetical protein